MAEIALYPIMLKPALHTRVWGGRRLETAMGKALPTDEPYGESWEMHDTSVVVNGGYAGKTVAETLTIMGTMADCALVPLAERAEGPAPYFAIVLVPGWERAA